MSSPRGTDIAFDLAAWTPPSGARNAASSLPEAAAAVLGRLRSTSLQTVELAVILPCALAPLATALLAGARDLIAA